VFLCAFDWTVRITDLLTVSALLAGPIIAVRIADKRQQRQLQRGHKDWVFRTLMTTKSSPLAPDHIAAINIVGLLFRDTHRRSKEPQVIEAWKLYRAHLDKGQTDAGWWAPRQQELLDDLLYKIGLALSVPLTVSEIKTSTSYYPGWYARTEAETALTRQLWLEVLEQKRALPITNNLTPPPSPQVPPTPSPPAAPGGT
jgi:hypothetical protein